MGRESPDSSLRRIIIFICLLSLSVSPAYTGLFPTSEGQSRVLAAELLVGDLSCNLLLMGRIPYYTRRRYICCFRHKKITELC